MVANETVDAGETLLVQLLHRAEDAAKSIIDALIRLFRQVIDWVYAFMYNMWNRIMADPWAGINLMANFWVLMM